MEIETILAFANSVQDPRKRPTRVTYSASMILTTTLLAVLAGCREWEEMADFAELQIDLIKKIYPEVKTTPSPDTFSRFFSLLKPKKFEKAFRIWVAKYFPRPKGDYCIDGKAMRGAASTIRNTRIPKIHPLLTWFRFGAWRTASHSDRYKYLKRAMRLRLFPNSFLW